MAYFIIAVFALLIGAILGFFASEPKRIQLEQQRREQEKESLRLSTAAAETSERAKALSVHISAYNNETARFATIKSEFEARLVTFNELQDENVILKRDLRNLDVKVRKLQLDRDVNKTTQSSLDAKVKELGGRYLKENVKWIGSVLNVNNFAACKQRLLDVIKRCRAIGYDVPIAEEAELISELKADYQKVVRAAFEREEQARIKAQIREEQQRQQEIDRVEKQLEREHEAIQAAVAKAIARAHGEHSEEVEKLKARLAEIQDRQRAISQAQITKAGFVYVISNIGSFGEGVFKVGMTRRLEPLDRVKELGDASVPFPFDVHMMVSSNDAPGLENALHRKLHKLRVNKTNPRKEFFQASLDQILKIVWDHHGEVEYVADAEALQYRQSLTMSEADEEFIESVFDKFEDENASDADEL